MDRAVGFARSHPELVLFAVGLALFFGGILSVTTGLFGPDDDPSVLSTPQVVDRSPVRKLVGPSPGADLAAYVQQRHQALEDLSAKDPRGTSVAVVTFTSYMKVREADQFFKARKMQVTHVYLRIPLSGFDPQDVAVSGTIAASAAPLLGQVRIDQLREEVAALEGILPETEDPAYRRVYSTTITNMRKGIGLLEGDPSVIYGAIVKTSHANLFKLAAAQGIRVVEVSDDRGASEASHEFRAILPELTDRA